MAPMAQVWPCWTASRFFLFYGVALSSLLPSLYRVSSSGSSTELFSLGYRVVPGNTPHVAAFLFFCVVERLQTRSGRFFWWWWVFFCGNERWMLANGWSHLCWAIGAVAGEFPIHATPFPDLDPAANPLWRPVERLREAATLGSQLPSERNRGGKNGENGRPPIRNERRFGPLSLSLFFLRRPTEQTLMAIKAMLPRPKLRWPATSRPPANRPVCTSISPRRFSAAANRAPLLSRAAPFHRLLPSSFFLASRRLSVADARLEHGNWNWFLDRPMRRRDRLAARKRRRFFAAAAP